MSYTCTQRAQVKQRIQFRVLGSLEVDVNCRPVPVNSRRQRVILAVLLLNRGRVAGRSELISAIWGAHAPVTAANQVAICVSSLRRLFAAAGVTEQLLVTRAPGYLLRIDPGMLDLHRVETAVDRARALVHGGDRGTGAAELRRALGLWRGPVLSGLASEGLHGDIVRWEERRLALTEEYADLVLESGHDQDLVSELACLVVKYPWRERIRAQYMRALCLSGRQTDALAVYRDGRQIFADELGIEPGAELKSLHQSILRGTPWPHPAPARRSVIGVR